MIVQTLHYTLLSKMEIRNFYKERKLYISIIIKGNKNFLKTKMWIFLQKGNKQFLSAKEISHFYKEVSKNYKPLKRK